MNIIGISGFAVLMTLFFIVGDQDQWIYNGGFYIISFLYDRLPIISKGFILKNLANKLEGCTAIAIMNMEDFTLYHLQLYSLLRLRYILLVYLLNF
jgi:hypothetical protein